MKKTIILSTIIALAAGTAFAQDAKLGGWYVKMDRDGDNKVSLSEFKNAPGKSSQIKDIDKDGDKVLTFDEIKAFFVAMAPETDPKTAKRISGYTSNDLNGDKKVTLEEISAKADADFKAKDKNSDGFITADEQ